MACTVYKYSIRSDSTRKTEQEDRQEINSRHNGSITTSFSTVHSQIHLRSYRTDITFIENKKS